ncbi:unnamed protein product [Vitrella brassicaformis CCMP3155]|uniref:SET domain-containing protein n=1 Tax=Vitrella brassicaformis (strain CCMP3155) TaxID=1169540 RepID=A0A0G4H6P0_VITBC|nr:unnamed protein product [Vitrella brassicaformis CCMP3155]|eukprot:CEM39505.1 unnamed protein product [Vitrella brassicaformis CCMP3155]
MAACESARGSADAKRAARELVDEVLRVEQDCCGAKWTLLVSALGDATDPQLQADAARAVIKFFKIRSPQLRIDEFKRLCCFLSDINAARGLSDLVKSFGAVVEVAVSEVGRVGPETDQTGDLTWPPGSEGCEMVTAVTGSLYTSFEKMSHTGAHEEVLSAVHRHMCPHAARLVDVLVSDTASDGVRWNAFLVLSFIFGAAYEACRWAQDRTKARDILQEPTQHLLKGNMTGLRAAADVLQRYHGFRCWLPGVMLTSIPAHLLHCRGSYASQLIEAGYLHALLAVIDDQRMPSLQFHRGLLHCSTDVLEKLAHEEEKVATDADVALVLCRLLYRHAKGEITFMAGDEKVDRIVQLLAYMVRSGANASQDMKRTKRAKNVILQQTSKMLSEWVPPSTGAYQQLTVHPKVASFYAEITGSPIEAQARSGDNGGEGTYSTDRAAPVSPLDKWKDIGNALFGKGKYLDAYRAYVKGVRLANLESLAELLVCRAQCHFALESYVSAFTDVTTAFRILPPPSSLEPGSKSALIQKTAAELYGKGIMMWLNGRQGDGDVALPSPKAIGRLMKDAMQHLCARVQAPGPSEPLEPELIREGGPDAVGCAAAALHLSCLRHGPSQQLTTIQQKCLVRLGQGLLAERLFDAADVIAKAIKKHVGESQMRTKADTLQQRVRTHRANAKGDFDWAAIYRQQLDNTTAMRHGQPPTSIDVAEYGGAVSVRHDEAQQPRLYAKEDIQVGQLLLVQKPVVISSEGQQRPSALAAPPSHETCLGLVPGFPLLPRFMQSHGAEEFGSPVAQVDGDSIPRLMTFNHRISGTIRSCLPRAAGDFRSTLASGVWILPSLIRHARYDRNAIWYVVGDLLVVRAVRPISRGGCVTADFFDDGHPTDANDYVDHGDVISMAERWGIPSPVQHDEKHSQEAIAAIGKGIHRVTALHQGGTSRTAVQRDFGALMRRVEALQQSMASKVPTMRASRLHFFRGMLLCWLGRDDEASEAVIEAVKTARAVQSIAVNDCRCLSMAIRSAPHDSQLCDVMLEELRRTCALVFGTPDAAKASSSMSRAERVSDRPALLAAARGLDRLE